MKQYLVARNGLRVAHSFMLTSYQLLATRHGLREQS